MHIREYTHTLITSKKLKTQKQFVATIIPNDWITKFVYHLSS